MNDYWSIDPSIAIALTGYVGARIIARRKRR